jgi:hypothetical protein
MEVEVSSGDTSHLLHPLLTLKSNRIKRSFLFLSIDPNLTRMNGAAIVLFVSVMVELVTPDDDAIRLGDWTPYVRGSR